MNQLFKNRIINIVVILLLIANLVTFGLFWWRQSLSTNNHPFPPPGMSKGGDYLTNELKFNHTQEKAFEVLRNEHRAAVDPIRKNIESLKNDFFGLVKNDTVSETTINNAWNKIASAEKEMDLVTLNHFKAVRKICDSAQQVKFDEIIQESIMRMRNRPQGPPPPQGHRPQPEGQGPPPQGHRPQPEGQGPPPPQGHRPQPEGQGPPPLQGHRPPPEGQGPPPPKGHRPPPEGKGPLPPQGHRPLQEGQGPPPQGHRPPPPPDQN